MTPFTEVQDGLVITHEKGIYRQLPLFRRDQYVYAKVGAGFIRLYKQGATSKPNIKWVDYDPGELNITQDQEFYLTVVDTPKRKSVRKAA